MPNRSRIRVINADTGRTVEGSGALFYLQTELRAKDASVRRKLRETSLLAAQSAQKSLMRDLYRHDLNGSLLNSVNLNFRGQYFPGGAGGGGSFAARAEVGEGVEHADWFFLGTGKYRKTIDGLPNVRKNIFRIEDYGKNAFGPINPDSYRSGQGKKYIRAFYGQEDNLDILRRAESDAKATVRNRLRYIK